VRLLVNDVELRPAEGVLTSGRALQWHTPTAARGSAGSGRRDGATPAPFARVSSTSTRHLLHLCWYLTALTAVFLSIPSTVPFRSLGVSLLLNLVGMAWFLQLSLRPGPTEGTAEEG
jgi:hypothetical protein